MKIRPSNSAIPFFAFLILWFTSSALLAQTTDDPEIAKWESEISHLESVKTPDSGKVILFEGSSSIRLWDSIMSDMKPYTACALGYGGAKLTDFVFYCDRINHNRHAAAIAVFIANDITGDKTDKSPEEVVKLFRQAMKKITRIYPHTPVFWIEVTPTPSRWNVWPLINEAQQKIEQICQHKKYLYFISTADVFLRSGKPDASLFREDMLHLNQKGYQLWANTIKQQFDAILSESFRK